MSTEDAFQQDVELEDDFAESAAADAPGVEQDVMDDGGIIKTIITPGEGWLMPPHKSQVKVHYVGRLMDEAQTVFDSSRDRDEPFTFTLGTGSVIKGWDKGVATMKKGEKSLLACRADYAYGPQGSPPKIPPSATLRFEVELLSWLSSNDISGDGGVEKTTAKPGVGWDTPGPLDEVTVRYSISVQGAGAPCLTSPPDGAVFMLREGHLCRALALALAKMKVHEEATLVIRPDYGFGAEGHPPEVPGDATLVAEIGLVDCKKVADVTGDGTVLKKVLKPSTEYKLPGAESTVKIRYTGRLADGTVFEERGEGDEVEIVIDETEGIVPGLEQAVVKMKQGEVSLVTVHPQHGYGDSSHRGNRGVVPPKAVLEYIVELVELTKAKEPYELEGPDQKVQAAVQRKELGNALFKQGRWPKAIKKYERALAFIEFTDKYSVAQLREAAAVSKSCNLNLAAAHLKLSHTRDALKAVDKVLEKDSTNVKALFRRAQALMATQDLLEAERDIRAALSVEPSNRELQALQKRCKVAIAHQDKKERSLFNDMFSRMSKLEQKEDPHGFAQRSRMDWTPEAPKAPPGHLSHETLDKDLVARMQAAEGGQAVPGESKHVTPAAAPPAAMSAEAERTADGASGAAHTEHETLHSA